MSIRIPVDLETLPMMLRFGVKLNNDLNNIGQTPILLHLEGLEAVMFSYVFISKGLSCLLYACNQGYQKPFLECWLRL